MIALTGAAGRIGTVLRAGLADQELRLIDNRPVPGAAGAHLVDLTDEAAATAALSGVDTVIHLAAYPVETAWPRILADNIVATRNVFEAARAGGARRVVYASSMHAAGFHPWGEPVSPAVAPRPDTLYGVSKVFGEALGSLYADKYGLSVVCLRIWGFADEPDTFPEYLAGWLSHGDAVRLFRAAVTAPDIHYLVTYGVSANTRAFNSRDGWAELGYEPQDDAEAYADRFPEQRMPRWHGGTEFTDPAYPWP